ncbi:alpha/beta hydrolase [Candidatus Sneabacter namystus]|uniref:Hydrolase n=1 Tax=Candidatus Sneabacter namystus TaxID=2601646 RepID=A0A5C0UH96_9RICK|nr:dienelactone hydrolase family protein [Candidatus Sneabacter namystus]QEK39488.1 hydrolase [Candidatus Sneabacter namystus]
MKVSRTNIGHEIACEDAEVLAVLLHGYGSSSEDLISLVPYISTTLQKIYWFAPNGVEQCEGFGYSWFHYVGLDSCFEELCRNRRRILDIIDTKRQSVNLKWSKVLLIGFSQGGMVALDFVTSFSENLLGAISFSGAFLGREVMNNKAPICMIHGSDDNVVPVDYLVSAKKFLEDNGCDVSSHKLMHLAHSIDVRGINLATNFINRLTEKESIYGK